MVQLQFRYSQFAFEPVFCCFPLVRSSRHKIRVEKERKKERNKLDGTRAELVCEMRCEADRIFDYRKRISSKERNNSFCRTWNYFIGRIFLMIFEIYYNFYSEYREPHQMLISCSILKKKREIDIVTLIATRTLQIHINKFL